MEFDFIKRLFSPVKKTPEPPKPAPAKRERRLEIRVNPPGPNLPKASELLAQSRALLVGAGAPSLAGRVVVRWNARMKSTAGMAYWTKSLVTLNPRLAQFGAAEIDRTLLDHDQSLQFIWRQLEPLLNPPDPPPKKRIGFHP